MANEDGPREYVVALPSQEAERLERVVASRKGLDASVDGGDIIAEALAEHLKRLEAELWLKMGDGA